MAVTIVSNLAVFADATGHGNQSHLVFAPVQQRWWLFYIDSKTATVVKTMVSSSADLTTATWSAGTASSAFPSSRAMSTNDQRNLGVALVPNSINANDAVHVSVGIGSNTATSAYIEHIRAKFTGVSSITWETWTETASGVISGGWDVVKGNALGVSTTGIVHESAVTLDFNEDANARLASNADTTSTWTNAFGANAVIDVTMTFECNAYALAPLASAGMLVVYDNGGAAEPNSTGLRYNKYASGTSWPTTGSGVTGNGTTSQDQNDWALCGVDTTHVFCVRRSGTNTFDMQMFNGSTWAAKTAPPTQNHKAGSGIFLATDGTNMRMFVLDSTGNNAVMWNKYTVASDTWGTWTQLEAAGSTARNYISGYPTNGNNQIGMIWTAVNGTNFDIQVSALTTGTPPTNVGPVSINIPGSRLRPAQFKPGIAR